VKIFSAPSIDATLRHSASAPSSGFQAARSTRSPHHVGDMQGVEGATPVHAVAVNTECKNGRVQEMQHKRPAPFVQYALDLVQADPGQAEIDRSAVLFVERVCAKRIREPPRNVLEFLTPGLVIARLGRLRI
jgi:hypothetical protein